MALPTQTKAPDFTLKTMGADGMSAVTLSEALRDGPVVLLFFPAAFSGVCTQELCDVSAGLSFYRDLGAQVLGISVDAPHGQAAWAKQAGINFPLLSDYARQVIRAYDVVHEDFAGLGAPSAKRAVFVIDRSGVIRHAEVTPELKDIPDFGAVKAALQGLTG